MKNKVIKTILILSALCVTGCGSNSVTVESTAPANTKQEVTEIKGNGQQESEAGLQGENKENQTSEDKNTGDKNSEGKTSEDKTTTDGNNQEDTKDNNSTYNNQKDNDKYEELYSDILDKCAIILDSDINDIVDDDAYIGLMETKMGDAQDALDNVGYIIKDISGDGIPELMVGYVTDIKDEDVRHNGVMLTYTLDKKLKPVKVFEGWYRNYYEYKGKGVFNYQGSGGAMYSSFGDFMITKDGTKLECQNYYYTYDKDNDPTVIGYYYSTVPDSDVKNSRELDMTAEEFYKITGNFSGVYEEILEFIPFSKYEVKNPDALMSRTDMSFIAEYTDKKAVATERLDHYVLDKSEFATAIKLTANEEMTDVKLLALEYNAAISDRVTFKKGIIKEIGNINDGGIIAVTIAFAGAIPQYGIQYQDIEGTVHYCSFEQSGMDGSVIIAEIE